MTENSERENTTSKDRHSDHQVLYHLVYVTGWCVITAAIDFAFLWPESHLLALVALMASLSLPITYEFTVWGMPVGWTGVTVATLFASILPIYDWLGPIRVPDVEVQGWLQPGDDPTPRTGCDPVSAVGSNEDPYWSPIGGFFRFRLGERPIQPPPKGATIVALGNNGVIITKAEMVPVIQIGECSLLSLQKTSRGLLVDANVYGESGKLIATIHDNAISGIEGKNSHVTREGDLSTLIVKEGANERLWVRFSNPYAIRVRGSFICPKSSVNIIFVRDDTVQTYPAPDPRLFPTVIANSCATDASMGFLPPPQAKISAPP